MWQGIIQCEGSAVPSLVTGLEQAHVVLTEHDLQSTLGTLSSRALDRQRRKIRSLPCVASACQCKCLRSDAARAIKHHPSFGGGRQKGGENNALPRYSAVPVFKDQMVGGS